MSVSEMMRWVEVIGPSIAVIERSEDNAKAKAIALGKSPVTRHLSETPAKVTNRDISK